MNRSTLQSFSLAVLSFTLPTILFFISEFTQAQNSMMGATCPMCGNMGWTGMTIGSILMIGLVIALVFLSVYIFRRKRL